MEIQGVKRTVYWVAFFLFMVILALSMISIRVSFVFRFLLILLLAFLSSMFRLEDIYSFLSIALTCIAGIFAGVVIGSGSAQIWLFAFTYVVVFFLSCYVFEKKMLDF
jgi:hypothetical protein